MNFPNERGARKCPNWEETGNPKPPEEERQKQREEGMLRQGNMELSNQCRCDEARAKKKLGCQSSGYSGFSK